jgi:glycosyltransferase 2 family protein
MRRRLRGQHQNVLLVALGFALPGHAVWNNRGQIREVFHYRLDGRLFLEAFAVYLVAMVLTFLRWHRLVQVVEPSFRLSPAVLLGFIGSLYNLVIPGAVGGDLIKAAYLAKMDVKRTQVIASLIIDRVIGLLGLFILAGTAGAAAWHHSGGAVRRLILVVWAAVALAFLGLAVIFNQDALTRRFPKFVAGRGRLATILGELSVMASTYRRRLGLVVGALGLSSLIQTIYVVSFYLLGGMLFREHIPTLGEHLLLVPLLFFTTAIPLPFGALVSARRLDSNSSSWSNTRAVPWR